MKYSVSKDIKIVLEALNISSAKLAEYLGVSRNTVRRVLKEIVYPSDLFIESFYSFVFEKTININKLKIRYAEEQGQILLFHGTKDNIIEPIDLNHSRTNTDLGKGFYLGENYEQASSYIFYNNNSSVYLFDVSNLKNLKTFELDISFEWMILVCYYRGTIEQFKNSEIVQDIVQKIEQYDVIIAPIADNNMYEIMNQFARGDITDLQATNALSASHLGKQHVLKTQKACERIQMINRLYLCKKEREEIQKISTENALISLTESKQAIEKYRRQGKYIEELLI